MDLIIFPAAKSKVKFAVDTKSSYDGNEDNN